MRAHNAGITAPNQLRTRSRNRSPAQPTKYEAEVDYQPRLLHAGDLADSPVRCLIGRPTSKEAISKKGASEERTPSDTLRELAFLDRINEICCR